MKPVSLEIKGLYSYRERQLIDFRPFYQYRLFGIFGKTGDGKSTILDAITYALFGQVDRLGRSIKEAINPGSQELKVGFCFEIDGIMYEIVRGIDKYERPYVRLYRVTEGHKEALAEKVREVDAYLKRILGLEFKEFTKVVILPQGKFTEFLKLTPANRAEMLERLFGLEIYGKALQDKVTQHLEILKASREEKEKQLLALKEVSKELIAEKRQEIKKIGILLKEKEKQINTLEKHYQILTKLAEFLAQKEILEKRFNELKKEEPAIKEKEKTLKQAEEVAPLRHVFKEFTELTQELPVLKKNLDTLQKRLDDKKQSLELAQRRLDTFNEELPKKLNELAQLKENAKQAQKLEKEFSDKKNELKENRTRLSQTKQKLREIASVLKKYRKQKEELLLSYKRTKRALEEDTFSEEEERTFSILQKNVSLLGRLKGTEEELSELKETITTLSKEEQVLERKIKTIWQKRLPEIELFSPERAIENLEDLRTECEEALKEIETAIEELHQRHLAASLAVKLKPNEPCPVCGSTTHPKPACDKEITKAIEDKEKERERLKTLKDNLNQTSKQIRPVIEKFREIKARLSDKHQQYREKSAYFKNRLEGILKELGLKADIKALEGMFYELKNKSERKSKANEEIRKITEEIQKFEEKIKKERIKTEGYKGEVNHLLVLIKNLEKDLTEIKAEIEEKIGQRLSKQILLEVEKQRNDLETKRKQLERAWKDAQSEYLDLKESLAKTNENLRLKTQEEQKLREFLIKEAEKRKLDLVGLKALLLSEKEMDALKHEIEEWKEAIRDIEGRLNQINGQINNLPIKLLPQGEPEATLKKLEKLREELKGLQSQKGGLENEIKNLEKKLEDKKQLEAEIKKGEEEISLASALKDCLHGKALLKFAAKHLFKNILHEANLILKDIIGGRFIIQMSRDEFNFSIYDPSIGHIRPIETLSGGETFLVSFALALALSSYIQKTKARPIHFFFVDEGFGSLDEDLLDAVAEVLNQLKQQERLVGIITHLEKFKQLLSAYILVKKDSTHTSLVSIHV